MKIIGVYPIKSSEACYLIEVLFTHPLEEYKWIEVTQEVAGLSKLNWQVPYDEQPIDDTGERWVFFFHYVDFKKPLLTPDGEFALPEPSPLPAYLQNINYQEPD